MLLVLGIFGSGSVFMLLCTSVAAQMQPEQPPNINFPYRVEETALIVLERICYEGPFVEDGSDREMGNVAGLVIQNMGTDLIEAGEITLVLSDAVQHYRFTMLPPGARLLVLETSGSIYSRESALQCTATSVQSLVEEVSVEVCIAMPGCLEIVNRSDTPLERLTVYYKGYNEQAKMYIGGITYNAEISALDPGQTCVVAPYHMACGYTKIVNVALD